VAGTQGEIGYVLQYAMWQMMQAEGLKIPVVSLITQVLVDAGDPAFQKPTKPIGPSIPERWRAYRDLFDWTIAKTPQEVSEGGAFARARRDRGAGCIKACVEKGFGDRRGGGGVPVFQ